MGGLIFPEGKPLPLSDFRVTLCAYEPTRSLTIHFFFCASTEILLCPGSVPLPSEGRAHLKELAAGGREETPWS